MQAEPKSPPRLIKRYGNRKLYDVRTSRYITLNGIRALVRAGEDVRVLDNDTGEDLTSLTFAQIIYEEEKRRNGILSRSLLRRLIERGDEAVRDLLRGVERGREALDSVREATERRMQQLAGKRAALLDELLSAPQRGLDTLQQRIDAQVRHSVERVTSHPAFQSEIRRIERSIKRLEKRLALLKQSGAKRKRRTRRPK